MSPKRFLTGLIHSFDQVSWLVILLCLVVAQVPGLMLLSSILHLSLELTLLTVSVWLATLVMAIAIGTLISHHFGHDIPDYNQVLTANGHPISQLLDALPVGVAAFNPEGVITYANPTGLEIFGLDTLIPTTPENRSSTYQLYLAGTDQLYPRDRLPSVRALHGEVAIVDDMEVRCNGQAKSLEMHTIPLLDDSGNVTSVLTVFYDIGDRKKAERLLTDYSYTLEQQVIERTTALQQQIQERQQIEKQLREKQAFLQTVLDKAPFYVFVKDWEGRYLLVNDAAAHFYQKTGAELLGKRDHDFHPIPEVADQFLAENRHLIETGEELFIPEELAVGTTNEWFQWQKIPLRIPGTDTTYVMGIGVNITARKQVEAELKAQQAFLRQVIDVVPSAIFVKDEEGRMLTMNQAAADMYDTTVEERLGKTDYEFNPDPAQVDRFLAINREVMQTRQPKIILAEPIHTYKGEVRWYQTIINPFINEAGKVRGIIGSATDITTLKQAETELRQAKEAAEAASRAKSAFLANMSHELRTPLNAILGFSQVMRRTGTLSSEQQNNLAIIHRSGEHLLTLINQVLDLSKIEAGRLTVTCNNFDLYCLLEEVEDMFSLKAREKGLQLVCDRAPHTPRYICLDDVKLRQILINLVGNAIKFTASGQVAIRVQAEGDQLVIQVEDTGVGIALEELGSLFEAFSQTSSGQRSQEGTGLGLTISRQYVRLMGGDISVHSQVDQGTTFTLTLPIAIASASDITTRSPCPRALALAPDQPSYRLLVVDDKDYNRQLLIKLLESLGFEVAEASNGEEAIALYQSWHPHLIWMDLRMPIVDGAQATRQIRNLEPRPSLPQESSSLAGTKIIALSASVFGDGKAIALKAQCDDFIRKPFCEEDIIHALKTHLGVTFIVEDEPTTVNATEALPSLDSNQLRQLPKNWLLNFKQAITEGEIDAMNALIGQIQVHYADLARDFLLLTNQYQFEYLLTFVESTIDS